MTNFCRSCGKSMNKINFIVSLDDEIDLNICFKDVIEYYCRIHLDDKNTLPQNVCFGCKTTIDNFIKFCQMLKEEKCDINSDIDYKVDNYEKLNLDENSQELIAEIS